MNTFTDTPVIVIGMHRSGTTMISEMLTDLGLFQGVEKDPNHEPIFFMEINDWLLRTAGGAWDYPCPFKLLLNNEQVLDKAIKFIGERMQTKHAVSFFGKAKWSIRPHPAPLTGPWGWKDPRNTITLPLWLKMFPNAKIIHMYRHGVDVAASLLHRNDKVLSVLMAEKKGVSRRNPLFNLRPAIVTDSIRCSTLDGGFSLWEEYMALAQKHIQESGSQSLSVSYEDFLASPENHLEKIAQFCGLTSSSESCARVAANARKSRAFSYKSDSRLSAFAASVADRLATYGY